MLNSEIGINPIKMIINNFRKTDQAEFCTVDAPITIRFFP